MDPITIELNQQFVDSLMRAVTVVESNTNSFEGFSLWVTVFTFTASLVTIVGFATIFYELWKSKTSRECQEKIILDLIRHMFVNSAISEAIRYRLSRNEYEHKDGVLARFCVLDSDMALTNLPLTAKNYEQLHELQLLLRNYNSVAQYAEKHFADKELSAEQKMKDLDELVSRSVRLTNEFLAYAKHVGLRLDHSTVIDYINKTCEQIRRDIIVKYSSTLEQNAPTWLKDVSSSLRLGLPIESKKNI